MAASKEYNAGAKASELVPDTFVVGEKTFNVKRSGKALRKIIELVPEGTDADDPALNIEMMYEGIALVLIDMTRDPEISEEDENGTWHPRSSWLEDEVDFEVAQDFMEKILPQRGSGNPNSPSV